MRLDKHLEDWSEDKAIPSITFHIHSLANWKQNNNWKIWRFLIVWRLLWKWVLLYIFICQIFEIIKQSSWSKLLFSLLEETFISMVLSFLLQKWSLPHFSNLFSPQNKQVFFIIIISLVFWFYLFQLQLWKKAKHLRMVPPPIPHNNSTWCGS